MIKTKVTTYACKVRDDKSILYLLCGALNILLIKFLIKFFEMELDLYLGTNFNLRNKILSRFSFNRYLLRAKLFIY